MTVGAIFDHAAISGPLSCEKAGGSPAMIWARSLFIISVVKPGTGECCQTPPLSSNYLPSAVIAAPSLPADHCEMAVIRGLALWARANAGSASAAADPASRRRLVIIGMVRSSRFQILTRWPRRSLHLRRPPPMRPACRRGKPDSRLQRPARHSDHCRSKAARKRVTPGRIHARPTGRHRFRRPGPFDLLPREATASR